MDGKVYGVREKHRLPRSTRRLAQSAPPVATHWTLHGWSSADTAPRLPAMCLPVWSWCMWLWLLCGSTHAEFTRLSSRTVDTKYGALKGYIETPSGRHLQPVEVFLGVPYATPPTGPMRFMPPVSPVRWRGVRMADRPSPVCPQRFPDVRNESDALKRMPLGRLEYLRRLLPHLQKQSEDCLYLNIYTPAIVGRDTVRLPVMMFIHGESYEWNAGNPYDGTVLASYGNVVVVTVNYRLGILGFLPAMEKNARGNNGLMDQVAALHWIQENIAKFGGDARNVTVFGHGTGAAFVNLLMLTPMARGLFQRAIMMSGSALSPWALARDATAHTLQVANSLGCPTENNQGLVECLRVRPAADLLRAQLNVPDHLCAFGPTVDGIVLAKEPQALMEDFNTQFRNFDVMMGVSRLESYFFITASEEKYGIEVDRRDRILRTLVRNLYSYHQQEIFLTIVNEYTDWTRPFQHPMNILDGTSEAVGDTLVVAPLIRAANLHSQVAPATFLYVFAYQSEAGDYPSRLGCVHGEELAYIFGAPLVTSLAHFPRNYTKGEQSLSEATMTFWTNFAKYGDPSFSMQDAEMHSDRAKGRFERLVWPPYEASHQKYLLIGMKPKVKDHYHAHRLSLWLHLIPQLHRPGGPEVGPTHHLLEDHDNPLSYDGTVRSDKPPFTSSSTSSTTTSSSSSQPSGTSSGAPHPLSPAGLHPSNDSTKEAAAPPTLEATPTSNPLNLSDSMMVLLQYGGYSTALSVTIAVGCSLLILNVLIFAGVYYQRDKTKLEAKMQKRNYKAGVPPDPDAPSAAPAPSKQQLALRAPPPSPVGAAQQGGCCGPLPSANDPRMVAATLPPKVPQKVNPPQPKPLPEAQPLLSAQGTATLGRIRVHHANKVPDGIVEMPMAEFDEAPSTPHHPLQQQESVCIMQWRKPL